jgi:hypothetical protein
MIELYRTSVLILGMIFATTGCTLEGIADLLKVWDTNFSVLPDALQA